MTNYDHEKHPCPQGVLGEALDHLVPVNEKERKSAKASTKKFLVALLGDSYTVFIKRLKVSAHDPKILALIKSGLRDGEKKEDAASLSASTPKVSDLHPSQSEIDIDKSLKWPLTDETTARKCLDGKAVEIMGPIIVFRNKSIVDGHHRWSQIYACNAEATVKAENLVLKGKDPIEALKAVQMAIAATIKDVPSEQVKGTNLLKAGEKTIKSYVITTLKEELIPIYAAAGAGTTREEIANYIWGNVKVMQKKSQPIKGAPDRGVMPQTDQAPGWDKTLKSGKINHAPPFVKESRDEDDGPITLREQLVGHAFPAVDLPVVRAYDDPRRDPDSDLMEAAKYFGGSVHKMPASIDDVRGQMLYLYIQQGMTKMLDEIEARIGTKAAPVYLQTMEIGLKAQNLFRKHANKSGREAVQLWLDANQEAGFSLGWAPHTLRIMRKYKNDIRNERVKMESIEEGRGKFKVGQRVSSKKKVGAKGIVVDRDGGDVVVWFHKWTGKTPDELGVVGTWTESSLKGDKMASKSKFEEARRGAARRMAMEHSGPTTTMRFLSSLGSVKLPPAFASVKWEGTYGQPTNESIEEAKRRRRAGPSQNTRADLAARFGKQSGNYVEATEKQRVQAVERLLKFTKHSARVTEDNYNELARRAVADFLQGDLMAETARSMGKALAYMDKFKVDYDKDSIPQYAREAMKMLPESIEEGKNDDAVAKMILRRLKKTGPITPMKMYIALFKKDNYESIELQDFLAVIESLVKRRKVVQTQRGSGSLEDQPHAQISLPESIEQEAIRLDEGSRNFWFSTATNERYKMILSDDGKVKFTDHRSKTMPSTFFMHEVNGAPFKISRINAWAKSLVGKTRVEVVREMLSFVDVAKTVESLEEASLPPQAYGVMRGKEILYLTNRSRAAFSWLEQTAMGDRSGRGGSDLQVVKNPQGWKRRWAQMGELLSESIEEGSLTEARVEHKLRSDGKTISPSQWPKAFVEVYQKLQATFERDAQRDEDDRMAVMSFKEDIYLSRDIADERDEYVGPLWFISSNFEGSGGSMFYDQGTKKWHYRNSYDGADKPMRGGQREALGNAHSWLGDLPESIEEGKNLSAGQLKKLAAEYEAKEDRNDHAGNILLLAKAFGTPKDVKVAEALIRERGSQGFTGSYMSRPEVKRIAAYYEKLRQYESIEEGAPELNEGWKGYDPDMPVQVVGVRNGKILGVRGKTEEFSNLEDAQKVYPQLDPDKNTKQFTWVMRGEIDGRPAGRFETWEVYRSLSESPDASIEEASKSLPSKASVLQFVKGLRTWFDVDYDDGVVRLETRDNGDVGSETPGEEDTREANRLLKKLNAKFGKGIARGEVVDEWVHVAISVQDAKNESIEEGSEERDFMSYLTRTLVPDLKDSGKTETAKDFLKVVSLLKSGKRDRKFEQYLERTLIPDLKDSGLEATSEDFEIGLYLMQKSDESSDRESDGGVEETTKFPTEHDIAFAEQVMSHIREHGRSNISSISQALNVEPDRLAGVMDRMKREDILLDLGGGMVSLPDKEPEPKQDNIDPATAKVVGSEVTTNESLDEMRLGDLFRGFYKKLQKGRKVKPDPQIAEILHADVTKPMSLKGMTQDQIKILAKHLRGDYRESQTTQVSFARSDAPDFLRIARAVGISESTPLTVTGDRFVLEAPSVLAFMLDEEEVECLA